MTENSPELRHRCRRLCLAVVSSLLVALPAAAADWGFGGVTLFAGINSSSDWDDGTTLGLTVDVGELSEGLLLSAGAFFSQADANECVRFSGAGCELDFGLDVEDLALGAEIRYYLRRQRAGLFFGGGAYVHQVTSDAVATLPGTPIVVAASDEVEQLGALALAGYELGRGVLQLRYSAVSDFQALQVLVGFRLGGN